MGGGLEESSRTTESNSTTSSSTDLGPNNEAGDFECNICFELAQDPVVTLCGHLFCWPCLSKWLHIHSQSHECPVCKAIIQENELIPLYGRGKPTIDPRAHPPPPPPESAGPPPPGPGGYFSGLGFGFLGGFVPMASASFGNVALSGGFGGLFPSLFSFQLNGFLPDVTMYQGLAHGFRYGYSQPNAVDPGREGSGPGHRGQGSLLKNVLFVLFFFVLVTFLLPGSLSW